MQLTVQTVRLPHAHDLPLPSRGSDESAGWDLRAAVKARLIVEAGSTVKVPTGLKIAIPKGWEGQVRPRSGLAARHAVTLTNSPGTIDADYRGEVQILLINHGPEPLIIERGDRIAQILFAPVPDVTWQEVESLVETERGVGGFGSTGQGERVTGGEVTGDEG